MKWIKLHTILSFYSIAIIFCLFYLDLTIIEEYLYILIIAVMIETLIFIKIIVQLFKDRTISYSSLYLQGLILVTTFYLLEFKGGYLYLILISTILLYYLISKMHDKVRKMTSRKTYYFLKIRNNFLLTVIYIGYGAICYFAFFFSHQNITNVFRHIEKAVYYVMYPYAIIIIILVSLQYDRDTDEYNTKQKYKEDKVWSILKRNLIMNALSLLFLMI